MPAEIRRTLLQVQITQIEGGQTVPVPTKLITALAIIKNPWFGRGFVENLRPETKAAVDAFLAKQATPMK